MKTLLTLLIIILTLTCNAQDVKKELKDLIPFNIFRDTCFTIDTSYQKYNNMIYHVHTNKESFKTAIVLNYGKYPLIHICTGGDNDFKFNGIEIIGCVKPNHISAIKQD